jgi:KaiC/GvpD/RAD55 family RecA-like ATPase
MVAKNVNEIPEKPEDSTNDRKEKKTRTGPQGGDRARIEFCPVPASELGDSEPVDWLWHGYIAPETTTLFVGEWKGGKTTLICHLLKEMANGGDLAGEVKASKVLIVSEETRRVWKRRRDKVGLGDHVHFEVRPFRGRPSKADWQSYIEHITMAVEDGQYDLLIIDTWASLNPCQDENDAVRTLEAVMALTGVTEAGAAVLLVHHPCKKDSHGRQSARGSGALQAHVDTIMELSRTNPEVSSDRRRTVKAVGRYEETPAEVVLELTDSGYQCIGSKADATQTDRQEVIKEILAGKGWSTDDAIRSLWIDKEIPVPGKRSLQKDLNAGCESGLWQRQGKGTKGDKYRYKFDSRTLPPPGASSESNATEG